MQIQNLFQPFDVDFLRANDCPIKEHKHTFYELVFIMEGSGNYHIDGNTYQYSKDDLFLIVPNLGHYTTVKTTTGFLFIKFHSSFVVGENLYRLIGIFRNQQQIKEGLNNADRNLILVLLQSIHHNILTNRQDPVVNQKLIETLLLILSRVLVKAEASWNIQEDAIIPMIDYIHSNISNPSNLRLPQIADTFNIAPTYVSEYFKKHTGVSLQDYILNYKVSMIEERLRFSNRRITEIAFELGFADESHLTKLFKKVRGVSPLHFRKSFSNN